MKPYVGVSVWCDCFSAVPWVPSFHHELTKDFSRERKPCFVWTLDPSIKGSTFKSIFPFKTLLQAMHFYIQTDMKRTALDAPYTCPYLVESKGDKFFTGQIGQGADKVSCDRLKPAILDETSPLFSPHPDEDVQGPKWQQWDQESGGLRSCSATKRTRRNRRTRLWKSRKDWCKSGSHAPSEVELLDSVALLTYNILHMPDRVTFS